MKDIEIIREVEKRRHHTYCPIFANRGFPCKCRAYAEIDPYRKLIYIERLKYKHRATFSFLASLLAPTSLNKK